MPPSKIDGNATACFIAEEATPKVLPGAPVWYEQEPNSYRDFGGEITVTTRDPITNTRNRQRGSANGTTASGGIMQDFTMSNFERMLRGFFYADYTSKFGTAEPNVTVTTPITAITGGNTFAIVHTLAAADVGLLLHAANFAEAANNGVHKISAQAAGSLTVTTALTNNVAPPTTARLTAVGFEFPAGDVALALIAGGFTLTSATVDMGARLALRPGAWIYVGGDGGTAFAQTGFARVASISANGRVLTCDKSTVAFAATNGAGITLRIFAGRFIRNEDDVTLQKEITYQIERQMGRDDDGVMSEVLVGAYANEFTLTIPTRDKLTGDLTFVALDNEPRTGLQGIKAGTRVKSLKQNAVNSSKDIVRIRMAVIDPTTLNPTPLFGYVTEGTITVGNGVKPNDAVGVFGAFSVTKGNFEIGGSITAFFSTMAAITAIRNNSDVTVDVIAARANKGFVFDIPLLGLGGGRATVEKDAPIKLPVTMSGAGDANGISLSATFFPYLPNVAMPV